MGSVLPNSPEAAEMTWPAPGAVTVTWQPTPKPKPFVPDIPYFDY